LEEGGEGGKKSPGQISRSIGGTIGKGRQSGLAEHSQNANTEKKGGGKKKKRWICPAGGRGGEEKKASGKANFLSLLEKKREGRTLIPSSKN